MLPQLCTAFHQSQQQTQDLNICVLKCSVSESFQTGLLIQFILEGWRYCEDICGNHVYTFNTYREGQVLAPEDPDARDAAVVVSAKQKDTGEGVLSEFVQALEHTWTG